MLKAFYEAKVALVEAVLLAHPHKGAPMALTTDASDEAGGWFCSSRYTENGCHWPSSVNSCVLQKKVQCILMIRSFWPSTQGSGISGIS